MSSISKESWTTSSFGTVRFLYPNLTEVCIGLIIVIGLFLGVIKRIYFLPPNLPSILYDALCFISLGFVVIRRILVSPKISYSPVTLPIFLFCFFAAVTIFNPELTSLTRGLIGWRFTVSAILLHFLGFYAFDDIRRLRRIMKLFWIAVGIVSIYGIVQLVRGYTPTELAWINQLAATMRIAGTGRYRLMATTGSAVDLVFLLAIALISLFSWFLFSKNKRATTGFLICLIGVPFLFTYVRAGWISILICFLVLITLFFWKNRYLKRFFLPFFLLMLVMVLLSPVVISVMEPFIQDPALKERVGSLSNPFQDKSMLDRYDRWEVIVKVIRGYPFGLGIGMAGSTSLKFSEDMGIIGATVDNSYLKLIVEVGWLVFFLFMWLVFAILIKGIKTIKYLNGEYKIWGIALWSTFLAFLIIMIFGEYIELNPGKTIIWLFTGFLFGLPRMQNAKARYYDTVD